jgi:NADH-quinone oxidoreductase subunit N
MIVNSVIGLFYYLRIIVAMFSRLNDADIPVDGLSSSGSMLLASLVILLIWLGVYPGPVIDVIQRVMLH